jgi:hypothetical protein
MEYARKSLGRLFGVLALASLPALRPTWGFAAWKPLAG